ncbi:MAG: 1-acyl-sn-glycerol-3-phosphate acyltransferase [Pseudomonadales bacterium]
MSPDAPFESIRPYSDEELPGVLARLRRDPRLLNAMLRFRAPWAPAWLLPVLRPFLSRMLSQRTRHFKTIDDFQASLEGIVAHMLRSSTDGFSWSGLEALDPHGAYLFVANHRDIALDSILLNYALHQAGFPTARVAIGDNLLSTEAAADLMRLNKSFIVRRSVTGLREQLAAFTLTSAYIHHSLEEGASVWIAQREGRAKDGQDRTDPAIIKMFFVSQRKGARSFAEVMRDLSIVPVAVSYELDPCDVAKARSLAADPGAPKAPGQDLQDIIAGITGPKGRVHLHFGAPLDQPGDTPEAVASAIDGAIHEGFHLWPTHGEAYGRLTGRDAPPLHDAPGALKPAVRAAFEARLGEGEVIDRWVLRQYAAPVALALGEAPPV